MPTAIVDVLDFWLPRGKKRWVAKTQNGEMYGVPDSLAAQVRKGATYSFDFKIDEFPPGSGRRYNVVEKVTPTAAPSAQEPQRSSPQLFVDERSNDIAVLAIIKEWVGKIPIGDEAALVHALRVARRAWIRHKGPDSQIESGNPTNDFNDEIPY